MARNVLRPIREDAPKRNKPFAVCDIETANWTKFLVIGFYDGQDECHYFQDLKKFLDFCLTHYDGYDIFAHFGGKFDFMFILEEVLKHGKRYQIESIVPRGSGILYFDLLSGESRVTFRDSSALLPFSLKRLTENFGVTHLKQEIDYSKIKRVTKELLRYLEYDLKGTFEVIEKFYSWPINQEAGRAYTLASQAMRVLRTTLEKPLYSLSKSLDETLRPAYLGGRVEIFKPVYEWKQTKKELKTYDVNSLYPTVMEKNEFPNSFDCETYRFYEDRLGFYECEINCPDMHIPVLGVLSNGKYIFPVGKFSGLFSIAEINYARLRGVKIKTGRGYLFSNGGKIFAGYVRTLWGIRSKPGVSEVDSTIAKLLLNSCYGRFGINPEKENIVFDDGTVGLTPLAEINVRNKTYRLMTKGVELDTYSNLAIAAYVTSYARIHMHRLYLQADHELYYTDTDSIVTTHEFKSGRGLGDLKLEDSHKRSSCFLLPKTYVNGNKVAMKGFEHKKIKKFKYEDFYACLQGDLKVLKITQEPKFATFKTALRQGCLVTMTKESSRQIRSSYDKRIVIKKGNQYETTPHHLK